MPEGRKEEGRNNRDAGRKEEKEEGRNSRDVGMKIGRKLAKEKKERKKEERGRVKEGKMNLGYNVFIQGIRSTFNPSIIV